jgi:hypothetical protein
VETEIGEIPGIHRFLTEELGMIRNPTRMGSFAFGVGLAVYRAWLIMEGEPGRHMSRAALEYLFDPSVSGDGWVDRTEAEELVRLNGEALREVRTQAAAFFGVFGVEVQGPEHGPASTIPRGSEPPQTQNDQGLAFLAWCEGEVEAFPRVKTGLPALGIREPSKQVLYLVSVGVAVIRAWIIMRRKATAHLSEQALSYLFSEGVARDGLVDRGEARELVRLNNAALAGALRSIGDLVVKILGGGGRPQQGGQ